MRNLKRYIGDITLIKSLMLVLYFHVTTKKIQVVMKKRIKSEDKYY